MSVCHDSRHSRQNARRYLCLLSCKILLYRCLNAHMGAFLTPLCGCLTRQYSAALTVLAMWWCAARGLLSLSRPYIGTILVPSLNYFEKTPLKARTGREQNKILNGSFAVCSCSLLNFNGDSKGIHLCHHFRFLSHDKQDMFVLFGMRPKSKAVRLYTARTRLF